MTNQNPGCIASILRLLGISRPQAQTASTKSLPFLIRDNFLTPAEISFYHVLALVVGNQALICPKVRLADIFYVARPNENMSYYNRITQKHIDFLLCKPNSMEPILGIELDDSSHTRSSRKERDEFVNRVFESARLALLHIPAQQSYNTRELAAQVARFLPVAETVPDTPTTGTISQPTQVTSSDTTDSAPLCPKCGVLMEMRTAKRGEHQGEQFYGCPNYPRCTKVSNSR